MSNALTRRYPEAERLPRIPLVDAPTPVERVTGPEPSGFGGELWVKRDDLTAPAYGGNKVRKLEYLLAEARETGAKRLITAGAFGSHHVLATTTYGRAQGFPVTAVLYPQQITDHVRDVLLAIQGLGTTLRYCPKMVLLPATLRLTGLRAWRDRPYTIPTGGSNAVGALGYVDAGLELADQVGRGELPAPDVIYVAAGTLGTVAGLALGLAMAKLESRIVGVKIVPDFVATERALRKMVDGLAARLDAIGAPVPEPDGVAARVELRGGYLGAGYGMPTEAGSDAARRFAEAGLHLDPTYTAKTAAAVLDGLRDAQEGVHLFWHTLSAVNPTPPPEVTVETLPPRFRGHFGVAGGEAGDAV